MSLKILLLLGITANLIAIKAQNYIPILFNESVAVEDLNDIAVDENNRLLDHWLLYLNDPICSSHVEEAWKVEGPLMRRLASIPMSIVNLFFKDEDTGFCPIIILSRGADFGLIENILPTEKITFNQGNFSTSDLLKFVREQNRVEVGWANHHQSFPKLHIYWVNQHGERPHEPFELLYGEKNTFFIQSYLGHVFEIEDPETETILQRDVISCTTFFAFGEEGTKTRQIPDEVERVRDTLHSEWDRSHAVKRTYTKFGFSKGKLPLDLYQSISTFYYNNRHNRLMEEWEKKGVHVNWYEQDLYLISMPTQLKVC